MRLRWYHFTRGFGAFIVAYGLLLDHTEDRGTIILGGLGLMGYDKVARSEKAAPPRDADDAEPQAEED